MSWHLLNTQYTLFKYSQQLTHQSQHLLDGNLMKQVMINIIYNNCRVHLQHHRLVIMILCTVYTVIYKATKASYVQQYQTHSVLLPIHYYTTAYYTCIPADIEF